MGETILPASAYQKHRTSRRAKGSSLAGARMRLIKISVVLVVLLAAVPALAQENAPAKPKAVDPASKQTLSQEQIQQLIRVCANNDLENDKRQRDYTYIEREEDRSIGGKGEVKSNESKTYDVMEIYGEPVQKLIAKNDKPLSAKDAQKEDEKIQKLIDKRKNESDSDREKRLKKEEKDRQEELAFVGVTQDWPLDADQEYAGHDCHAASLSSRAASAPRRNDRFTRMPSGVRCASLA